MGLMCIPDGSWEVLSARVRAVTVCLPVFRRASAMGLPLLPPAFWGGGGGVSLNVGFGRWLGSQGGLGNVHRRWLRF